MRRPRIFSHHLYELKKGLRHLILFTTTDEHRLAIVQKLERHEITYLIQPVAPGGSKINVFVGDSICIDVIRSFGSAYLSDLIAEEDFILGVMLGYDRVKHCERYLRRRQREDRDGEEHDVEEHNGEEPEEDVFDMEDTEA